MKIINSILLLILFSSISHAADRIINVKILSIPDDTIFDIEKPLRIYNLKSKNKTASEMVTTVIGEIAETEVYSIIELAKEIINKWYPKYSTPTLIKIIANKGYAKTSFDYVFGPEYGYGVELMFINKSTGWEFLLVYSEWNS